MTVKLKPPSRALTKREKEMLNLRWRGLSNVDISKKLGIRPSTAEAYLRTLFAKLQVGSIIMAYRHGLILGLIDKIKLGSKPEKLSPSQLKVLRLKWKGLSNTQICEELNIPQRTPDTHINAIRKKWTQKKIEHLFHTGLTSGILNISDELEAIED